MFSVSTNLKLQVVMLLSTGFCLLLCGIHKALNNFVFHKNENMITFYIKILQRFYLHCGLIFLALLKTKYYENLGMYGAKCLSLSNLILSKLTTVQKAIQVNTWLF